jgi:adenylate kinase
MKIVLFGIPGAGKSTQGNLLSKQLHIPYLSTGHIFRKIAQEKTQWGRFIKETMAAGLLIPNKETIEIVNEYLGRSEYKAGYILDGFPRNLHQAKTFSNNVDYVLYLKVSDKESLWRIAGRSDEARNDDTIAAVKKRIDIFHEATRPVLEYYRKAGRLIEVDGSKSIKQVNEFILKSVGKTLGKNGLTNWYKRRKVLLCIVGLPGAGKSVAADFYKERDFPVIRLGQVTDDILKERNLENNNDNNRLIREEIRSKHGMDAYIKLNFAKIKKSFEMSSVVVLDGMRSYEEYLCTQKEFKNVFLLGIVADKQMRYNRLKRRKSRSNLSGPKRDTQEVINLNMGPTIALADKLIINNGTRIDFEDQLEEVYREVYFGLP